MYVCVYVCMCVGVCSYFWCVQVVGDPSTAPNGAGAVCEAISDGNTYIPTYFHTFIYSRIYSYIHTYIQYMHTSISTHILSYFSTPHTL